MITARPHSSGHCAVCRVYRIEVDDRIIRAECHDCAVFLQGLSHPGKFYACIIQHQESGVDVERIYDYVARLDACHRVRCCKARDVVFVYDFNVFYGVADIFFTVLAARRRRSL